MRQVLAAKVQPKQQQHTIIKGTEGVGGGGEEGSGRVLMTIELELTQQKEEESSSGEGGTGRSEPAGLLSRLSKRFTFK